MGNSLSEYRQCKHCPRVVSSFTRGLCWKCYKDRTIRELYPLLNTPSPNGYPPWKYRKGTCPGCERVMRIHARGLCGTCYLRPEVRARFTRIGNRTYRRRRDAAE